MIVESIAEILNKTDGADLRMNDSGTAGDKPCTYLVDDDLENSLKKRVSFQLMSNSLWKTQDKLPKGEARQHVVHEVGCSFDHRTAVA